MKILLLIFLCPLFCKAQYEPNKKLFYKTTVITDTGVIKGYYVTDTDSAVTLCTQKKYATTAAVQIPVGAIKELRLKNKPHNLAFLAGASVLCFMVTAGLTQDGNDIDNDGKTSFFELMFAAIEGTTSRNRSRRTTALIAGAAGGTAGLLIGIFTRKKLSVVFPVTNRHNFYSEKKWKVRDFASF